MLTTARLELWQPCAADEQELFELMQAPAVWRHFGAPSTRPDHNLRFMRNAGSWLLHGYGGFIVREIGGSAIVGNCGVFHSWRGVGDDFDDKPEAGWILAESHFSRGFAHEAMRAALAWFDAAHGPREVVCMIAPQNAPSIALAGKLGFVPTRSAELPGGEPVRLFSRPVSSVAVEANA
ncbi:GNAT family N-acetyltransferase [Altererythrobacter aerius]|uniref:GNAT family N-acetyltransferase n=2 Tax=Tsuneonella aeria TaxID=1837929 RepID=A0A6I4TDJ4_9SPHN|nr:GNAT family N-acetyltransferase [Tsuneonella aeria]